MNDLFTDSAENGIIGVLETQEEDCMPPKFYNFNYIILYAYMDTNAAHSATQNSVLNTPIDLYESPYMAKLFVPSTSQKTLMAFAVGTQQLYDELDLELEQKIAKSNKTEQEIRKQVPVIRLLGKYKQDGKKAKPYIKYTVQDKRAIQIAFPIKA